MLPRIVIEISPPTGRSLGKFGRSSSSPHLASSLLIQHDHEQRTALRKVSAIYPSRENQIKKGQQIQGRPDSLINVLRKTSASLSDSHICSTDSTELQSASGDVIPSPKRSNSPDWKQLTKLQDRKVMRSQKGKPQRWTYQIVPFIFCLWLLIENGC